MATYQVHEKARTLLLAVAVNPIHQDGTKFLSQEKTTHQEHISMPTKTYVSKKSHGHNKRQWNMNSQVPLQGETLHVSSPVPEGNVQQKDNNGDKNQHSHNLQMYKKKAYS